MIALYVLVSLVTVGHLAVPRIVAAKDYALAEAARPLLGQAGFTMIAIAAMLSTASAINATLYGTARLSYCIAKAGELPELAARAERLSAEFAEMGERGIRLDPDTVAEIGAAEARESRWGRVALVVIAAVAVLVGLHWLF